MFNYHPILMVLGFGVLGFNGMLLLVVLFVFFWNIGVDCFTPRFAIIYTSGLVSWRLLPAEMDRRRRKAIHLSIQTVAYLLAVIGVRAVFKFHNEHVPAIANMYSLHSWLGITVMVLWGLQVCVV